MIHTHFTPAAHRTHALRVDPLDMARILICEPHQQVRELIERVVTRLGHEPVAVRGPSPQELSNADVFVLEPAAPIGATLAQAASVIDRSLPLICVSVTVPSAEFAELGVVFAAILVKPFASEQLSAAIEGALRVRDERPPGASQTDRAA